MEVLPVLALPDAVHWPPVDLAAEPNQPYDLAAFFSPVPPSENAAPLYLDALAEFDSGMSVCFPEKRRAAVHERGLRRQEALAQILDSASGRAALWVNAETQERVLGTSCRLPAELPRGPRRDLSSSFALRERMSTFTGRGFWSRSF